MAFLFVPINATCVMHCEHVDLAVVHHSVPAYWLQLFDLSNLFESLLHLLDVSTSAPYAGLAVAANRCAPIVPACSTIKASSFEHSFCTRPQIHLVFVKEATPVRNKTLLDTE